MFVRSVTRRLRPRRLAQAGVWFLGFAALSGLIGLIVHDLYLARPRSSHAITLAQPSRDYRAVLQMSAVTFDQDRLVMTATMSGRAWRPLREEAKDGATIWVSIGADLRALTCEAAWGEETLATGRHDLVTFTCNAVSLAADVLADEVFYPFDEYRVSLRPRICIDYDVGNGCPFENSSVAVDRVELNVSDRTTLQITPTVADQGVDQFYLSVRRKLFLRVATGTFGVLAMLFLIILSRLGKPEELIKGGLGYFGTLWALKSLIVPTTVRVFPNVVDYAIFTLFIILFVILFLRWCITLQEDSHAQASEVARNRCDTVNRRFE